MQYLMRKIRRLAMASSWERRHRLDSRSPLKTCGDKLRENDGEERDMRVNGGYWNLSFGTFRELRTGSRGGEMRGDCKAI
ncbi:protein of unknown function [Nitrospira japonica]|uniref:Uncharacterized protein n=1 Tax=Nitrospira japonica TaxID=1325564 RepID=A0A1W1I8T2_9BACT|nr:protein of unknown function [Nitrospira japonica]